MLIEHCGYRIKIHFSSTAKTFYGEILDHSDLISFQAASLQAVQALAFEAIERDLLQEVV